MGLKQCLSMDVVLIVVVLKVTWMPSYMWLIKQGVKFYNKLEMNGQLIASKEPYVQTFVN